MSAIISFIKNCLQVSNSASLLRSHFCGSGLSGTVFAAFKQEVKCVVAVH